MNEMPRSCSDSLVLLARDKTDEICGFIMDDWSFMQVPNVAEAPQTSFFFDPVISANIMREYYDNIVGIYHSHPGGKATLSIHDKEGWHPSLPWRYFIIANGKVFEWERLNGDITCAWVSQQS